MSIDDGHFAIGDVFNVSGINFLVVHVSHELSTAYSVPHSPADETIYKLIKLKPPVCTFFYGPKTTLYMYPSKEYLNLGGSERDIKKARLVNSNDV